MDNVTMPDAVALFCSALNAVITEPVVGETVPDDRPAAFVLIRRVGGPRASIVSDRPQLVVEAWAGSPGDAHDLCQQARTELHNLARTVVDGVQVYGIDEVGGPAFLPDPTSSQDRYTFSAVAHVRGAAV